MLFLLSFSFLLCRNESSAWSVSGHRIIWSHSSLFLVFYFIRPCANVPNTVTRWLHPTWFLPVVTPENQKCWERKPRLGRGRCRGVQTSGWFWGWRNFSLPSYFSCYLKFSWNSLISFREGLYCEVNNDFYVFKFRNMFNALFKHW